MANVDKVDILSKGQDKIPDLIKCMIDSFIENDCSFSEIEAGKIENEGKKAKNPKVQLTENGVLNLYKKSHKQIYNMQVMFLARTDTNWYLRLSDGKYISPIIRLYKKSSHDSFSVGAVLSIKEVVIRSNDELDDSHDLEDPQDSRVIIKDYNVLEQHTSFSSILGKLKPDFTYRDSIKLISDLLIKIDPKWETTFKGETKRYERLKEDGERLRERGNALCKKKSFEMALQHYEMAKQKDPYDFRVWSNSSHANFSSGEFKKAEDEAVMAIKLNPFSEKAYQHAGKAALKQFDKESALEYIRCGLLICGADRDLQKLLEECADDESNTDEESEKHIKVSHEDNLTTVMESTSSPDESIRELLYDDDIKSKCSWERIKSKSDAVALSDDDKKANDNDIPPLMGSGDKNNSCSSTDGLATFRIRIADVGNGTNQTYSQTCYVRNTPWTITFMPRLDTKQTFMMCAFLKCDRENDLTGSCNVTTQISLLSIVKRSKSISFSKVEKKINDKEIKMVIVGSIEWHEVINPENGYVKNGIITVEIHLNARFRTTSKKVSIKIDEPNVEKEEVCTSPPIDPYHRIILEGKKNYEEGQYLLALRYFEKPVPKISNIKPSDLEVDGLIVQFLIGICKIQSGKAHIIDGIDTIKSLTGVNSTFSSVPSAHYWLSIGFERLFLLKLAHDHGLLCRDSLKSSKCKGIKWPGSEDIIIETKPDKLASLTKELLGRIAATKPMPKARCRFINCISTQNIPYAKEEIYLSDPDFKGYLNVACEEYCIISYHPCCWKAHKESLEESQGKMIDKDFLDQTCKTPDCSGKVCSIHIYDEAGCLKNTIQKEKAKKEAKPLSIIAKQKKKKEKKEKRTLKNDSKNKKFEIQNEANKENREDKENIKEENIIKEESITKQESISKQESIESVETDQQVHKDSSIIPSRISPQHIPQTVSPVIPEKEKSPPTPTLPIDPESLATERVTILLPPKDDDFILSTTNKKNKKKKKKKQNNTNEQQADHVLDPLEAEKQQRKEYLARLRSLREQRELSDLSRLKNMSNINNNVTHLSDSQYKQVIEWLDPQKPFYLPQHLRDNPEELERCLQTKIATTGGPDVSQETIVTLLNFMYEWLKEQGPISINDQRIREYVIENFPPEAKNHINHCGSIKEFLMQSIDFALIDDLICVRDHVVQAQEMTLKTIHDRMRSARYLLSDGKKSQKLDDFVDDDSKSSEDMSNCSSSSSSMHVIKSMVFSNSGSNSPVSNSAKLLEALEAPKLSKPGLELKSKASSAKDKSTPVLEIGNKNNITKEKKSSTNGSSSKDMSPPVLESANKNIPKEKKPNNNGSLEKDMRKPVLENGNKNNLAKEGKKSITDANLAKDMSKKSSANATNGKDVRKPVQELGNKNNMAKEGKKSSTNASSSKDMSKPTLESGNRNNMAKEKKTSTNASLAKDISKPVQESGNKDMAKENKKSSTNASPTKNINTPVPELGIENNLSEEKKKSSTKVSLEKDKSSPAQESSNKTNLAEEKKKSSTKASLENDKSNPALESGNKANCSKEEIKSSTGGTCDLDDVEMPEKTNKNKRKNKSSGNAEVLEKTNKNKENSKTSIKDDVMESSAIGAHKELDEIFNATSIPVAEALSTTSAQPSELVSCDFPQADKAFGDSQLTSDTKEATVVEPSPAIMPVASLHEHSPAITPVVSLHEQSPVVMPVASLHEPSPAITQVASLHEPSPAVMPVASLHETEEVFLSDEEEAISPENQYISSLELQVVQLRNQLLQQETHCQVLRVQNEEVSDKFHQYKTKSNLELNLLKKQIEELNDKLKSSESVCTSISALRESERRKFDIERTLMQDEIKNLQSLNASVKLEKGHANDRIQKLEEELKNEIAIRELLNGEMKNLQESLTTSSQRAHDAEVKYLGTKKTLVEQHLKETMDRWNKEVARMRQLLVHSSDSTIPERSTLSQSIMVWDAHISNLNVVINSFVKQGEKFLGMVNQGRPLSGLPAGDLQAPPIPDINVADLLCLGQKTKVNMSGSGLLSSSSLGKNNKVDSAGRGSNHQGSPTHGMDMNPGNNGITATTNNNAESPVTGTRSKVTSLQSKTWPDSHQLFVGQLPWNYSENDLKKFFTEQFGEVVSVTINDNGGNSDGKNGPKYGYVVFRKAEDRDKALKQKPIMINKHAINVQAKVPSNKHLNKSAGTPPGLTPASHSILSAHLQKAGGRIPSPPAPIPMPLDPITITTNTKASTKAAASTKKSGKSLYDFTDISLNPHRESPPISGENRSGAVSTPTQSSNNTPTSKPKLHNLTSNNVGSIVTPPPKLIRPQPSRPGGGMTTLSQSNTARGVSKSNVSSTEDSLLIGGSAYKKLIEVCKQRLGQEYAHSEILVALRDVRQRNNSTLSGLSLDIILERVRNQLRSRRSGSGGASVAPWAGLAEASGKSGRTESEWNGGEVLSPEDQCSICLEALATRQNVSLQCGHVFHESCVKDWLKRQSNCPNCRKFALMSDEYPSLS